MQSELFDERVDEVYAPPMIGNQVDVLRDSVEKIPACFSASETARASLAGAPSGWNFR